MNLVIFTLFVVIAGWAIYQVWSRPTSPSNPGGE